MFSIYLGRTGLDTYYTYRVDSATHRLEEQQTERSKTIDKLKAATKYNSTQQLLEKYGGEPPKPASKPRAAKSPSRAPRGVQKQSSRTSMGPPATANIPANQPPSQPSTPQPMQPPPRFISPVSDSPATIFRAGPPEFAPNAFSSAPQYDTSDPSSEGNWYDRILDLLLGDDETSPKNRVVLICQHCRLVNGQAPPGVKRLSDLGNWRCIGCGGWNGEQDEGTKIVEEIKEKMSQEMVETSDSDKGEVIAKVEDVVQEKDEVENEADGDDSEAEDDEPALKPRRGRSKKGTSS